mmetsp:Transcript_44366/g.53619  ORF Transcript_44366/g.53619 Transcript_44366/m.53619 type:complete len:162 (+) Transcript_44366:101-586(+)|eukprot:CAMPEP_0172500368 /NCGR_PEP_ID=MMETSP1066-20121228/137320_1 /TAXON_ID=671091 /ORGANISM="Coscinodiscus wailesii, Strain CCMP2513" /LENGTH=161 /DNA_ID=CAMNT_0013274557 /DNA_START=97 /DNA_END=582 /DNA_ORIENTATION=+
MPAQQFGLASSSSTPATPQIDSHTPWLAAAEGNLPLLLESISALSLPLTAADTNGYTFVHAAAANNQLDVLKYLIANGGDVNALDSDGDTPLFHCENAAPAKLLVGGGADWKIKNEEGKTALDVKVSELLELEREDDSDVEEDHEAMKELVGYLKELSEGA